MQTIIAIKTHNNSPCFFVVVDSVEIGIEILREWMYDDGIKENDFIVDTLRTNWEYHDESDSDNLNSYSISIAQ